MNRTRAFILVLATPIVMTPVISQTALAGGNIITKEDEAAYSLNDIMFYHKCPTTTNNGASEICGDNKNYAGEQVFTDEQMKAIEANQPFYEKAASEYDIPWQIIAVIHKREHGLVRSNPSNGQGVYQFYSAERRASCSGGNFSPGKISDEQFQIQTNCAAKAIKDSYGSGLDLGTDNGVKKMFFRYNGTAQAYIDQALKLGFTSEQAANGEGSPYVMNRYDAKREPSNTWGQIKTDGGSISYPANKDFGAFVYYKAITCDGSTSEPDDSNDAVENPGDDSASSNLSSTTGSSGNAQKIATAAFKLAYPKGQQGYTVDKSKSDYGAYPAFVEATKELGSWDKNKSHGPDCGFFVKAVLAYANPDLVNKPSEAVMDGHQSYAKSHPDMWEVIDYSGKKIPASELQSGDAIWWKDAPKKQHYFIVAKSPDDGNLYKVEASYCSKSHWSCGTWGRVTTKLTSSSSLASHKEQLLFRAKGGSSDPSCGNVQKENNNINATGAALAWPLDTPEEKYTLAKGKVLESAISSPGVTDTFPGTGSGTVAFQKAWVDSKMSENSLKNNTLDNTGVYSWRYGAYCCGYTATVVRYSGYDPHFSGTLSTNGYEQVNYARKHSDLWEVITWDKKKSSLKGGDVLVSSTHSWMVVEDESGELYRVEASLHSRAFGHISNYNSSTSGTTYIIRAKNANNSNVGVSVTGNMKSASKTGTATKAGKGNGSIGASAIELAWPQGTAGSTIQKSATEKFSKYFGTLSQSKSDSDKCYAGGKSCDRFVATVIRHSGVDPDFNFGPVDTGTLPYLEKSPNWSEVKMSNPRSVKEYQSGDVLIFYKNGASSPSHVGLYATDASGQGHVVQASYCEYFGVVKDTSSITGSYWGNIRIFRNQNNNGSSDITNCNICGGVDQDQDQGGDGETLIDGGVTSAQEAQKIVDAYNKANLSKLSGLGYACNGDLHKNCVNFPKWFIATYLSGMNHSFLGNGGDIAKNFYNANKSKFPNLKESNVPVAYSIFSVRHGQLTSSKEGHTGVVLGVKGDQVFIGEAGWCSFAGKVTTISVKNFVAHQEHKFIDVNDYIKGL